MKLQIDTRQQEVVVEEGGQIRVIHLSSPEAFSLISQAWLLAGWEAKHVYSFTWLGRPIIQLPEDMVRMQEVIFNLQPDVIIETGVAHGGMLVFYASLCQLLGKGRVIGVEVELRPHNRQALAEHPLRNYYSLIEGSSTDEQVVAFIKNQIRPGETVLVGLDSNHTQAHVLAELEAYAPLVTSGSYLIAMDGGIMSLVADNQPEAHADWLANNPQEAARAFAQAHPEFVLEEPSFNFNEGRVTQWVSYWRGGFLRRK